MKNLSSIFYALWLYMLIVFIRSPYSYFIDALEYRVSSLYHSATFHNFCGDNEPDIDEYLVPYVEEWKHDCDSLGINIHKYHHLLNIHIGNAYGDKHVGVTYRSSSTIIIDTTNMCISELRLVVYHELAHFVFDMEHIDDEEAIMYKSSTVFDSGLTWHQQKTKHFKNVKNLGY